MKQVLLSLFCLFSVLTVELHAQTFTSQSNGTYDWALGTSWIGSSSPGTNPIQESILITGNSIVQSNDALTIQGSTITVDNGSILYFNNDVDLIGDNNGTWYPWDDVMTTITINDGGTLVTNGDLYQGNAFIFNEGTLVVTGAYTSLVYDVPSGDSVFYYTPPYNIALDVIDGTGGDGTIDPSIFPYGDETDLATDRPNLLDIISSPAGPLPVILREFYTEQAMQGVAVNWVAESEINFSHYELYHSTDGENFELIKTIQGVGTEAGATAYQYMHGRPQEGWNYYRLVAIDIDGFTEDHGMRSLFFEGKGQRRVVQNPVANQKLMLSPVGLSEDAQLVVFSMEGNQVYQAPVGEGTHQLNAKPGLYILKIMDQGGTEQHRVIIQ